MIVRRAGGPGGREAGLAMPFAATVRQLARAGANGSTVTVRAKTAPGS
jgi:hypothetical protein